MADERALSISEAMSLAKRALESVNVHVIGEVSEFNDKPGYKAAYFTVCDDGASMPCMMWRDAYVATGMQLRCGSLVEMWGTFSAYVPKGRMQFMVKRLAQAGEGTLRMQVAALARKLEAEGLMRPERKRPLPRYPQRIAVVTSPRGKAVHDCIRALRRRYPLAELLIAGVAVEGAAAPQAIVAGLEAAVSARPDVVLLVRGGGSYEDLMPFNHEAVARAVATCPVPVVTGIGHEPDDSIADMVADLRASTPTAAAEAVSPSVDELATVLDRRAHSLGRALAHRVQRSAHSLQLLAARPVLRDPVAVYGPAWQRLDGLAASLSRAIPLRLQRDLDRTTYLSERMVRIGPGLMERARSKVSGSAARLNDLSPLAILGRGYAVCFAEDGSKIIKSADSVTPGDRISVRVADGDIGCVVETTRTEG